MRQMADNVAGSQGLAARTRNRNRIRARELGLRCCGAWRGELMMSMRHVACGPKAHAANVDAGAALPPKKKKK